MVIASLMFSFFRILELVTLIPTLGMLVRNLVEWQYRSITDLVTRLISYISSLRAISSHRTTYCMLKLCLLVINV